MLCNVLFLLHPPSMLSIYVPFYSCITIRSSPQIADETAYFDFAFIFVSLCSCSFVCTYERHAVFRVGN